MTLNTFVPFIILLTSLMCGCRHFDDDVRHLHPCDSKIFCYGPLLEMVQINEIHPDSKTFVDMKLKNSPNETMLKFEDMMMSTQQMPTRDDVKNFVYDNFDSAGSEFENCSPSDWKSNPKFIDDIKDPNFKGWANSLHRMWIDLCRKIKDEVRLNPDLYSIIYVPHPIVVPGGRFREFYYWDSYWIARGLLLSEMYTTVKGMISNFLSIVDTYGHIPNGGRVYYSMRSQPPMLLPMMKSYMEFTNDTIFLQESLLLLEREFNYWLVNHTIGVEMDGKTYTLARYKDSTKGPRPESYREDIKTASVFRNDKEKEDHYSELKAAAESGWDFSSRWFIKNETFKGKLSNLKTRYIIPVDLNALMYWNAKLMSEFFSACGHYNKALYYETIAIKWADAVTAVLWHEEVGSWLDYDLINEVKRDYFYPTNISPLWTGCYNHQHTEYFVSHTMKYLDETNIMGYPGGVPTTFELSYEQWDYPNAWPPLQYIMVMALDKTGDKPAQDLAYKIANRWIQTNYNVFKNDSCMYEKYDATNSTMSGGGGEYEVQKGFGWTNAIILEFLNKYGWRVKADGTTNQSNDNVSRRRR